MAEPTGITISVIKVSGKRWVDLDSLLIWAAASNDWPLRDMLLRFREMPLEEDFERK